MAKSWQDIALTTLDEERDPVSTPSRAQVDRDAALLASIGKRQVLKRRFGLFSMSGLAIAAMISWEGIIVVLGISLANGGPAGAIYSIIVAWIGAQSVFFCMGELASMMPTAGGQYHWASYLAPPSLKRVASYVTGWLTVIVWIATPTAISYTGGAIMLELIHFLHPGYVPAPFHGLLVMWGILAIAVVMNTILGALLPALELLFLTLHVLGFFALLIPMLNLGAKGNAHQIFTEFWNEGGWSSQGLSFLVGLQAAASSITGTDCSIHMAEELRNAELNAPRSMSIAVAINGAMSVVITFVFLYVAGPLEKLLDFEFPFINIIYNATGNSRGATATLVGFVVVMNTAATVSAVSTGSRMVWSFARDKGLPFSAYIQKVDKRFAIPMVAIGVVTGCAGLVGLIQLGSSVVLQIVTSILVEGFLGSYLCVLAPLLYHRIRGNIKERDENEMPSIHEKFCWGPWRLKGLPGILNNILAVSYLLVAGFFSFWPPTVKVDATSMNYSSLLVGGTVLLSSVYYCVWGRRTFSGPIMEIKAEHREPRLARNE